MFEDPLPVLEMKSRQNNQFSYGIDIYLDVFPETRKLAIRIR
jgi:hypothetical protein